jgi:hypothetical protein
MRELNAQRSSVAVWAFVDSGVTMLPRFLQFRLVPGAHATVAGVRILMGFMKMALAISHATLGTLLFSIVVS